ncbi:MAG: PQQ-dependent sugar dehydrogenase [Balneolales bacterium]
MNSTKNLMIFVMMSCVLLACSSEQDSEPMMMESGAYFPMSTQNLELVTSNAQNFYVQTVVEGMNVPWGMAFLPDGRVLITERSGSIHIVENGELREEPLQNAPEAVDGGQGGMLDIVLHPDYDENGWIYVSYSRNVNGGRNTVLSRMRLDGYAFTDVEEIYVPAQGFSSGSHFGGRITFDDDRYVYMSIGDRGNRDLAQDLSVYNSMVLRLHDDGSVPSDNPFVNDEDALSEIYSYGHRNIQGMQLHPETRMVWSHEHGPRGGDEVNIVRPGRNYGWPEITYGINYDGSTITSDTARAGMEQPLLYWRPSIAPSGLAIVASDRYPGWSGNTLLAGALSPQYLHRVELNGEEVVTQEELLPGIGRIRDVRVAPDGYIYLSAEHPGIIYRLIPAE